MDRKCVIFPYCAVWDDELHPAYESLPTPSADLDDGVARQPQEQN
jgi:hypothetical protein